MSTCSLSSHFCLPSLVWYRVLATELWALFSFTGPHSLLQHHPTPTGALRSQQRADLQLAADPGGRFHSTLQIARFYCSVWRWEMSSRSENSTAKKNLFRRTRHMFLCCTTSCIVFVYNSHICQQITAQIISPPTKLLLTHYILNANPPLASGVSQNQETRQTSARLDHVGRSCSSGARLPLWCAQEAAEDNVPSCQLTTHQQGKFLPWRSQLSGSSHPQAWRFAPLLHFSPV